MSHDSILLNTVYKQTSVNLSGSLSLVRGRTCVSYLHLTLAGPLLFENTRSVREREADVLGELGQDPPVDHPGAVQGCKRHFTREDSF